MSLADDIAYVQSKLERFSKTAWRMGVADTGEGRGVPREMFDGKVNSDGWVEWKMLPSTLTLNEVQALESEFDIEIPPMFRAYLLAYHQLYNQVHSSKHDQLIFNMPVPLRKPLEPLKELILGWDILLPSNYIPFGEWGDGWGPMCFDTQARHDDGDCPIVWMDHELLIPLGDECSKREKVLPLAQPIYDSFREYFDDVFEIPATE